MSSAPDRPRAAWRRHDPFERLPIRVRLATVSTALTFVILCSFAVIVGDLTVTRIRSDFDHDVERQAGEIATGIGALSTQGRAATPYDVIEPDALLRVVLSDARTVYAPRGTQPLGPVVDQAGNLIATETHAGYFIVNNAVTLTVDGISTPAYLQYARPLSDINSTIDRVRLLLFLGVLAGTGLALLAGLMLARRAMAPIARLTSTARKIADTRDPSLHVPEPDADDEVAELARTLEQMLRSLDAARTETEATLARQRQFVADASHELRTPLTSVLANLELLAESLHGDEGDAASSALRSTQRMRRLVADLLMLARSDVGRVVTRQETDLARIAVEAAAELEPIAAGHTIELDVHPAPVVGVRDELFRVALNLIENAVRHTPAGTRIGVRTGPGASRDAVQLVVEDDGPGIPPELAATIFERFVRGAGDRGGSFGLGLAIVRAVATSHGGDVRLESPLPAAGGESPHGARFVVTLPARAAPAPPAAGPGGAAGGHQTHATSAAAVPADSADAPPSPVSARPH